MRSMRALDSRPAQERWGIDAAKITAPSAAAAPLISGGVTTGQLVCVKFRRKKWRPDELNAIQTVASLLAQLQARIAAEEQLRYLAEHDDLTGLHNRRALMAHLSDTTGRGSAGTRLGAVSRPGPVEVDQRLSRPYRRRLVHPDIRRASADEGRREKHDRPPRR